ncbi:MAG: hypothetical protein ACREMY_20290, partial [bacterium]
MWFDLRAGRARLFAQTLIVSILLTAASLSAQVSYSGTVPFPATTDTYTTHCEGFHDLSGPGGGDVILTRGQFIVNQGTTLWASENIGSSGCIGFMALTFNPRATSVSFELRNLTGSTDVITVNKPDGRVDYAVPPHGSVGVISQGSIQSMNVSSAAGFYAFGVANLVVTQPPPNAIDYYLQFQVTTDPAAPYIIEKQVTSGGVVNSQISLGTIFGLQLVKKTGPPDGIRTVTPIVSAYSTIQETINPPFETVHNLFDKDVAVSLSNGEGIGTASRVAAAHLGIWKLQILPVSEAGVA